MSQEPPLRKVLREKAAKQQIEADKWDRKWRIREVVALWIAAGVGLLAIIVSTCDSSSERKVMGDTLSEMQAEQRPWVSIPSTEVGLAIQITEPLSFDARGGGIRTSLILRNSGKKPAFGVRWNSKIIAINYKPKGINDDLAAYCEPIRRQPPEATERTLFPDDRYAEQNYPSGIYPSDIAAAFANIDKPAVKGKLSFALIGCVDYLDDAGIHHQSRYVFLLIIPMKTGIDMGFFKPEGAYPDARLTELMQFAD